MKPLHKYTTEELVAEILIRGDAMPFPRVTADQLFRIDLTTYSLNQGENGSNNSFRKGRGPARILIITEQST